MKTRSFLIPAFVLVLSLAACSQRSEPVPSPPEGPDHPLSANAPAGQAHFSYEEDAAVFKEGDPGVNPNEFVNTAPLPIEDSDAAVERARGECTIAYDTASASYDDQSDMWRVDFYNAPRSEDGTWATAGNCQSVYMTGDGVTQLIVYGE